MAPNCPARLPAKTWWMKEKPGPCAPAHRARLFKCTVSREKQILQLPGASPIKGWRAHGFVKSDACGAESRDDAISRAHVHLFQLLSLRGHNLLTKNFERSRSLTSIMDDSDDSSVIRQLIPTQGSQVWRKTNQHILQHVRAKNKILLTNYFLPFFWDNSLWSTGDILVIPDID
jgi:hypothetical protein